MLDARQRLHDVVANDLREVPVHTRQLAIEIVVQRLDQLFLGARPAQAGWRASSTATSGSASAVRRWRSRRPSSGGRGCPRPWSGDPRGSRRERRCRTRRPGAGHPPLTDGSARPRQCRERAVPSRAAAGARARAGSADRVDRLALRVQLLQAHRVRLAQRRVLEHQHVEALQLRRLQRSELGLGEGLLQDVLVLAPVIGVLGGLAGGTFARVLVASATSTRSW